MAIEELGQGIQRNSAQKLVRGSRRYALGQVLFQLVLFSQRGSKVISFGGTVREEKRMTAGWRISRLQAGLRGFLGQGALSPATSSCLGAGVEQIVRFRQVEVVPGRKGQGS